MPASLFNFVKKRLAKTFLYEFCDFLRIDLSVEVTTSSIIWIFQDYLKLKWYRNYEKGLNNVFGAKYY